MFYFTRNFERQNKILMPKSMPMLMAIFPNGPGKGGSRAAATSKIERFLAIVNGFQPLTIITKRSILNAAAAPDPHLTT